MKAPQMRGFRTYCLADNKVQNRPWGKPWGKVRSERGAIQEFLQASQSTI
jgi:hypothetical protein